jgi:hypothetical protein
MLRHLSIAAALAALVCALDAGHGAASASDLKLVPLTGVSVVPKVSCRIEFDGGWGEFEIKNNSVAPFATGTKFSWKTNTGRAGVTKPIGYPLPPNNEAYFPSMFQRKPGDPDKTCTAKVI